MSYGSEDYWMSSSRLMATLMTNIKDAIIEGSGLFEKLDAIDGGLDGIITLADLNSGECDMLAKLLGIQTSVETGGNLIDALDALDGTMDGKLTLAELNVSDVKTNLDTSITRLDTTITKLTDQITELVKVRDNTDKLTYKDYLKVDTSLDTILSVNSTFATIYIFRGITHPANTANITFTLYLDAVLKHTFVIAPGSYEFHFEHVQADFWNIIKVVAASGTQYYKFFNPWDVI